MLSVLKKGRISLFKAGATVPTTTFKRSAFQTQALHYYSPTRHASILPLVSRPTIAAKGPLLQQQQRLISFWNIPLALMKASPIQRRLALVGLGGASLAVAVILGPFLLVGLGGIAAVMGFRFWRFRNQLMKQATGELNDWPDLLNTYIQQQGQFGRDPVKVEAEAIKRLEMWIQTEQGRNQLVEYGIHPETVTKNVSMRGTSFASTTSGSVMMKQVKIELDLLPNSVLIAKAQLDKEGNINMSEIKLVTPSRHVLRVPLTIQNFRAASGGSGRVIEGEFRDVQ